NSISDKRIYNITVQQLLEHTAGWDRTAPSTGFAHSDSPFFPLYVTSILGEANPVGDSTLVKFSLRNGLNNIPGTRFVYSNVGYLILGKVIEKVSGMKYERFFEKEIFKPLGISDIHLGNNMFDHKLERESEYFSTVTSPSCYGNNKMVPEQYGGFNLEAMNAHGGWVASAPDLVRLLLAADGFTTFPDIITPSAFELMKQGGKINPKYAKGWFVNRKNNIWHSGSLSGTASFISRTHDGFTTAFLFNSRSDNSTDFWNALERLNTECTNALRSVSGVNLFAPERNMSDLNVTRLGAYSVNISWLNGTGNGRIIIASEDSALTSFPQDGTKYSANAIYGAGTKFSRNAFVVYNGSGNNFILKGIGAEKKYFIYGMEYNHNPETSYKEVYKVGGRGQTFTFPVRSTHKHASSGALSHHKTEKPITP
ncbi:MAG: beta-lactamase family protein, partial [Bacteroidetes bacterium]|nr:beta-lactamase family protein [Bacteroidota bacterium]